MISFPILAVLGPIGAVAGGVAVLVWRVQETRAPVSARRILLPPLGMSSGFGMFIVPAMRIPFAWAGAAFVLGAAVLSWPLARTSRLHIENDVVWLKRSNAFLLVILALLAIRLALRDYVGHFLTPEKTAAVFFILAFGMIVRWRAGMYLQYRRLLREQPNGALPV